ncbi:LURP-one-like protein [Actinidia rufa]|uniref:LURP-one-like protein n=1 Tax=Actinidia rufa TaxID=165716 RepID=A0A7J0D8V2_9ERIC|nr:LURP-one-like protein [Actinidia rufa]
MANKVYPQAQMPTCSSYMTSKKETFTIWMKSLVLHGNGCTVFDSNGEIIYRIDNYDKKNSDEVYLMDLRGKVLFSIQRKVRPKQLSSGVMLGDDVLTLVVEPQMDHSLVMALVTVYGLMTDKI